MLCICGGVLEIAAIALGAIGFGAGLLEILLSKLSKRLHKHGGSCCSKKRK